MGFYSGAFDSSNHNDDSLVEGGDGSHNDTPRGASGWKETDDVNIKNKGPPLLIKVG